jgi:phage-related minor tail protein
MASTKIRGIKIEITADTEPLVASLKNINSSLAQTDKALKDVNKLLKLDPTNVALLEQKQGYLNQAIDQTKAALEEQQKLYEKLPKGETDELTEEQKALAREIEGTKQRLAGYETELAKMETTTDEAGKGTKTLGDKVKELAQKMAGAKDETKTFGEILKANLTADALKATGQAIVNIGKGVLELGKNSAKYADDVMVLSTQFGLSTDTIQEFQYMAELTDTSLETITGSLAKLTKNMQTATKGTGDAYKAFEALGVSITDSNGELRSSEDVFNDVINALGQMDNQTQADAYAMQIFGKSAMELNPLIEAGSDAIAQYAEEAHQMGYVLDSETLESLGALDDSMQRSQNAINAVKNQIGSQLAPIIADITEAFAEWAMGVDWKAVGNTIKSVLSAIGKAINVLIPIVKKIIEWAGKAVDAISKIFSGKFEWPHIKMPHFSISPKGWKIGDLLKGSIPHLNIDWYAKGMSGMVLDGATIFGMNKNGQLMAGGEKGREIIIGEDNLMNAIRTASGGTTINVVINESNNAEATAQAVINRINAQVRAEGTVWR